MEYYLGVDIGTTSSKAVAFSNSGEVVYSHSISYDMTHPRPGWSEQSPGEIFEAVINVINNVVQNVAPNVPGFISFSAAMHSLIAINSNGDPITNCIIWADNRADLIAGKLRLSEEGKNIYELSGVPVHSMSPLSKILWLRENEPGLFQSAHKFIGIKEFIFHKIFQDFLVDTSIASATGLLNCKTLEWDENILRFAGVSLSQLSQVVSTKTIVNYNNHLTGLSLPEKTPFIMGASDGALSNLGTGAINEEAMALTIGTSGAARTVVTAPVTDPQMRTFCYHLKDNLYVSGGANNNGAVVMQWLKESLLQSNDDYEELLEKAAAIAPGSEGLIFLPYILGERAPIWNANAKGVFFGLNIEHTKAHLVRASLEGVIYSMYSIAKILAEQHTVTELRASGGFAKSSLWLQILADVCNIKVLVSDTVESSSLGAVMLGAEALGLKLQFKNEITTSYQPNLQNFEIYARQFKKFQRLYQLLESEMVNETIENDQAK